MQCIESFQEKELGATLEYSANSEHWKKGSSENVAPELPWWSSG